MQDNLVNFLDPIAKVWANSKPSFDLPDSLKRKKMPPAMKAGKKRRTAKLYMSAPSSPVITQI